MKQFRSPCLLLLVVFSLLLLFSAAPAVLAAQEASSSHDNGDNKRQSSYFASLNTETDGTANGDTHDKDEDSTYEQEKVNVSAECAAVLLVGSGAVGSVAVPLVSTQLLALMGFTATGVAAGSFAAKWQATIGLVSKGSLFAALQSAAMVGAGHSTTIVLGSAFVSAGLSAQYLQDFCARIDQEVIDETPAGKLVSNNLRVVQSVGDVMGTAKDWMTAYVQELARNERIASLVDTASDWTQQAASWTQQQASGVWDWSWTAARSKAQKWTANEEDATTRRWGRALNELLAD